MVEAEDWGTTSSGLAVHRYTLRGDHGLVVGLTDFGATLLSIRQPDSRGNTAELTLGYSDIAAAEKASGFLGVTVGRYANRIAAATFTLDDQSFELERNNGANHLHGGSAGFHSHVWDAEPVAVSGGDGLRFQRISPDGEAGYPGEVHASVTFSLRTPQRGDQAEQHEPMQSCGELRIEYKATTDAPTIVNLTNHMYLNLGATPEQPLAPDNATVDGHVLSVAASSFVALKVDGIPTGEIRSVAGSAMDLRSSTSLAAVRSAPDSQIRQFAGLDHTYILDSDGQVSKVGAVLDHPGTGRRVTLRTTKPGLHVYTANNLAGDPWPAHSGIALETHYFPDSPNQPRFPSATLRPGEIYRHDSVYSFWRTPDPG